MPIIGGGGGGGMALLFDALLAAGAASIDTGAIALPQTGKHLLILATTRTNNAGVNDSINLTFNNDAAAHYNEIRLQTANTTVTGAPFAGTNNLQVSTTGNTATANIFGSLNMTVLDYTNAATFKTVTWTGGNPETVAAQTVSSVWTGAFAVLAAVTRVAIAPAGGTQLVAGSRLTVYALP